MQQMKKFKAMKQLMKLKLSRKSLRSKSKSIASFIAMITIVAGLLCALALVHIGIFLFAKNNVVLERV
jgi:hypothetical protein